MVVVDMIHSHAVIIQHLKLSNILLDNCIKDSPLGKTGFKAASRNLDKASNEVKTAVDCDL